MKVTDLAMETSVLAPFFPHQSYIAQSSFELVLLLFLKNKSHLHKVHRTVARQSIPLLDQIFWHEMPSKIVNFISHKILNPA